MVKSEREMGEESGKNKVKFLCSYGGKVLPRPSDGVLRYVGGETRVVSVGREVTFRDLMKKVRSISMSMSMSMEEDEGEGEGEGEGEVVLKYQLISQDLDALVSVRTDEDVKHMIEEHDRHHTGTSLLRAFLFPPSKAGLVASDPYPLEQRYIDSINGIIRSSPRNRSRSGTASSPSASPSPSPSPDCSPRYANANANANAYPYPYAFNRVRSSPSLTNMNINMNMDHHHHMGRPARLPAFNYYYTNTRPHRPYAYLDDFSHPPVRTPTTMSKSIWE